MYLLAVHNALVQERVKYNFVLIHLNNIDDEQENSEK